MHIIFPIGISPKSERSGVLRQNAKSSKQFKITTDSHHSFPIVANALYRKLDVVKPEIDIGPERRF